MIKKLNYILIFLITFCYVNNQFINKIGMANIELVITILGIIINFIAILKIGIKKDLIKLYIFLFIGIILTILGISKMGLIASVIGFTAIFLNMLFWLLVYNNTKSENVESLFKFYININIGFACIIGILGIYQYFIDTTVFGMVSHSVYGNEEIVNSGKVVRRVTSLIGSPQNYSLYMAIMTYLSIITLKKSFKNMCTIALLIISGVLSGSRAYTMFLVISLIFMGIVNLIKNKKLKINKKVNLVFIISIIVIVCLIPIFKEIILENATINRIFIFFKDWPALQIFTENLKSIDGIEFILGKGIGYNERIVAIFLGIPYQSVESYLLSVLLQGGIILLIVFISNYIYSVKMYMNSPKYLLSPLLIAIIVNLAVTPSFNGMTMSFIVWPFIIYPFTYKKYNYKGDNK